MDRGIGSIGAWVPINISSGITTLALKNNCWKDQDTLIEQSETLIEQSQHSE